MTTHSRPSSSQSLPDPRPVAVASESNPHTGRRFRWKTGLGILIVAVAVWALLWVLADDDVSAQVFLSLVMSIVTAALMAVWWIAISGLRFGVRLVGIALVAGVVAMFFGLFRFEGLSGAWMPRFALRSSPTPEERAMAYFKSNPGVGVSNAHETAKPVLITDADWPQFRGPRRDGIVRNQSVRLNWDVEPPVCLWRHPVGPAWSSFAMADNLAITQEQRGKEEVVACYDVHTGDQLWVHADTARYTDPQAGTGPRATPTIFDSRVFSLGAFGLLNCLEARTGRVIWSRDITKDAGTTPAGYGMCSSPLIVGDSVIVNAGGNETEQPGKSLIAYNRVSGDIVWAHGNHRVGYASPVHAEIAGSPQILAFGNKGLAGHDAAGGEELWWFPWDNFTGNNCADPIVLDDGKVFLSCGYGKGTVLLDVRKEGGAWSATPTGWKTNNKFKLKFNNAALKEGHVYGLNEGILSCIDTKTGEITWKKGRFGFGQLLLVQNRLIVVSDRGKAILVKAEPDAYREIAAFDAVSGMVWNHIAMGQGLLLIRSESEAACFDLRDTATAER